MSRWNNRRFVTIVVVLLVSSLPAANFAADFLGLGGVGLPGIQPVYASGATVLGIDCGLGSTAGVVGSAPAPPVIGDGILDTSCSWIGDVDASPGGTPDGINDPLVSDSAPTSSFPGVGGGFSAEVRIQGPLPSGFINGLDVTASWDTRYLYGVKFDQAGLPFDGAFSLDATIDNNAGKARLAQTILGGTITPDQNGGITLFRIRFDVVGVGVSPITISNDVITDPGAVPHKTQAGAFESQSFFDPTAALGWDVSWTFSPNPEIPGSPTTFDASASCSGCGTLTFDWDWTSDGINDASGTSFTLTAPLPVVHRVVLTVSDGTNSAVAVRRLPLNVAVAGPTSGSVASSLSYSGMWLGGVPNYSGSWRFCPSTTPANQVCSSTAPPIASMPDQTNAQTLIYRFAGTYTNTLRIQEGTPTWISTTPNAVTSTFLVDIGGSPAAYAMTVTTNVTAAAIGDGVSIQAVMKYVGDTAVILDLNNNGIFDAGETILNGAAVVGAVLTDDPRLRFTDANANGLRDQLTERVFYDVNGNNAFDAATDIVLVGTAGVIASADDARIKFVDMNGNLAYDGGTLAQSLSYPGAVRSSFFDVFIQFGDGLSTTVSGGRANCAISQTLLCTANATKTYSTGGTFTITATATETAPTAVSRIAETGTSSITIGVQPLCAAAAGGCDFTVTPASPTAGQDAIFTVAVNGGTSPYQCSFDFGDGTSVPTACSTGSSFSHPYSTKGSKNVVLTITDSASGSSTVPHTITVQAAALVGDFTFTPAAPTSGKAVTFTATASGGTGPYTFSWAFGDTNTGTGSPVSHTYAAKGSFSVVLTVTDANSETVSVTKTVVVVGQPLTGDFTFSPPNPTTGKPVTFTATPSGGTGPYTFSWNFGDTNTGSGNPVSHTYAAQGSYDVVLTLTDANDVSQTASHTVAVASQAFSVDFTFSPAAPTANKPVTFTATVTGGTPPFTYTWNFGDGTTGTGVSPTHSYTVKGSYQVVLSVSDSLGETGGASHAVTVASQPLGVDFSATGDMVVGGVITFTVTSNSGGTSPYSFEWDFGDGSIASGIEANHTYAVKGSYTVKVTMTDANGDTASASKPVTIAPQPLTADFTSSPASPTTGTPVAFNATASGGTSPYTFAWEFGDGTSGSGASPTHTYTVKGSYTVTVTVTDANSVSTTATHLIIVTPQPLGITGITVNPAEPIAGQPATLTAVITGGTGPYTVTWDFGDNSSGTGNPVTHTYAALGNYTVTVTVTDANQAEASLTATVTVVEQGLPLVVDFAPTRTLVGTTSFVAKITGGTPPYTCSWNFGDGTPVQAGCNTDHTYTLAGSFSATLTVVDSSSQTASASNTVVVEPAPRLFRGKVHWTHHLTGGTNATQNFMAKISNPSSFTVEVTLTVDIFTDTGVFVARVTGTTTLAPFSVNLGLTVPWTPTMTGKFTLTATLTYRVNFGDLSVPADGIPEMVTGTNGSKSGAFAVVP